MRLNLPVASLKVGKNVQEESFGIGNLAIILHLLRSKMYSNPIRTIVQEIGSNARDANREVGNGDKPIYIKLPNKNDPELWIQDIGPGISPERMSGVYLQYGNSTKRETDDETGCFGLGAKSPFSYVSSFGVETVTSNDDGTRTLRVYVATIDEKQIGKVLKVNEVETKDPCGTTVKIPIKPQDFAEFRRWTNYVLNRWNPLPKVNEEDVFDKTGKPDIVGEDWEIFLRNSSDEDSGFVYYEDQIPYPVVKKQFEKLPEHLIPFFNRVRLNVFGKGEVLVTGNRESLDYQPQVQQYLVNKLESIYKECNETLTQRVADCDTLWDAMCMVHKQEEAWGFKILKDVEWKGQKVPAPDSINFRGTTMYNVEGDSSKVHGVKIKRRHYLSFSPRQSNMLIENYHGGRPNPAYVSKAYEFAKKHFEDLDIRSWNLFILSVYDEASAQPDMEKVRYADWGVQSLKDFKPERKPRQKRGDGTYERSPIIKVRQFNPHCNHYSDNYEKTWHKTELDTSSSSGGVYIPLHSRQIDEKGVTKRQISTFCNVTGQEVYGIPRRFTKKGLGPQWVEFKTALNNAFEEKLKNEGNVVMKYEDEVLPNDVLHYDLTKVLPDLIEKGQVNGKLANWFKVEQNRENKDGLIALADACGRTSELTFKKYGKDHVKEIARIFPILIVWDGCKYGNEGFVKNYDRMVRDFVVQYVRQQEDAEAALERQNAAGCAVQKVQFGILKS